MKLFNAFALLVSTFASVYASGGEANNEMTFYGCPEECSAQEGPSCPQFDDDNLPSHFAALSTHLDGYDDYCGHYAVFMLADGSKVNKIARATVVDSCSSCATYHLDLSKVAFGELREHNKGTGKIIWGIYSKHGEKLGGPWYNSVDGTADELGMSDTSFVSAFDYNAKKLASSSHNTSSFDPSARSDDFDTKKTSSSRSKYSTKSITKYTTRSRTTSRRTSKTLPHNEYSKKKTTNTKTKTIPSYNNNRIYSRPSYNQNNQNSYSSKTLPIRNGSNYSNAKTLPSFSNGNAKTLPSFSNGNAKTLPSFSNGNAKTLPSFSNGNAKTLPSFDNVNPKTLPAFGNYNPKTIPPQLANNNLPSKTLPVFGNDGITNTKTIPLDAIPGKTLPAVFNTVDPLNNQVTSTVNPVVNVVPTQTQAPTVNQKKGEEEKNNLGTTVGLLAIGGGCLGAAGAGLFLLKKKNPSTYEDMKQKFPEAFSTVKRSLSRGASSIKRGLSSRGSPNENGYTNNRYLKECRNSDEGRHLNEGRYLNENRYQNNGRYSNEDRFLSNSRYSRDGRYYV